MAQSHTSRKMTTSSSPMTRSMTSSLPFTTYLSTGSNAPSPTASEKTGSRFGKSIGIAGAIGVILAIAVLAAIGVVWRRHRQHKAVKARMLASSRTNSEHRAMPLETPGYAQRGSYLSLSRGRNEPSESSVQLVQTDDRELGRGSGHSEPNHRQKRYQPTSGYSYPGERPW